MNPLFPLLVIVAAAGGVAAPRYTEVALTCESGCVTADSVQVADALRAGLAHEGVTVVVARAARGDLHLLVTGRISVDAGKVRVAAELQEMLSPISRYSVVASREELAPQVRKMGERFGRAVHNR